MNVKQLNFNPRQWLIVVAGCVVALLLIGFALLSLRPADQTSNEHVTTKLNVDPDTGQEYVTQTGVAPEQLDQSATLFTGFGTLLDHGLTLDQISGIEAALQQYQPLAEHVSISLVTSDFQLNTPQSSDALYRWSISSHIVVNQKISYQIKIYYWGTTTVQVLLYDSTGQTQLFDSGTVTGKS